MKKHFLLWVALVFAAQMSWGVDPSVTLTTYYAGIDGKATDLNDALRVQLCAIISEGYTSIGYSSLADKIYAASSDPSDFYVGSSNTMEDIYSSMPYTSSDGKSSATNCGQGWNKEHTVPQSWFKEASPMKSDAHHVFPTDTRMNSCRSSYPYGENNEAKYCNSYGYGHLGASTFPGYDGTVFDPGTKEECGGKCYRGDLARVYFYMATRYRTTNFTNGTGGTSFTYTNGVADLTDYMKNLMLKWHREDPVSEKELIRNNAIYAHQKNRNPFVDYPCLVEYIWGEHKGEAIELSALVSGYSSGVEDWCTGGGSVDPTPTPTPTPIPADYYLPVAGLKDSVLKSRLAEITWAHFAKVYSYGDGKNNTWDAFWQTDRNAEDNSVIDMYSNNKRYFNPNDTTASVTDCDIEHMFPNSWFGAKAGNRHAYSDLHHLVPADYSANRSKSNRGPGIPIPPYTFDNGIWINGNDADGVGVFCPSDEYKGDFARAFFYVATTYGDTAVWQAEAVPNHMTNDDWHEFLDKTRNVLLKWHREDPVSEKEVTRNNTVYGLQGNRNPFIDYPCLAEYIWGTLQGEEFELSCSGTPTPKYTIKWNIKGKSTSDIVLEGIQPTAPSVEDCSADRVFVGWTTSNNVTSEKPDVLYKSSEIPEASGSVIYYAVFADKVISGGAASDYVLYNDDLTEGDYIIYYSGKAMKASTFSAARLEYTEVTPSDNTISSPAADIVWHIAPSGDYWTIYNEGVKKYAASTGTKNQATLNADGNDAKSLWTASDKYEFTNKHNSGNGVNALLRNNGTYGFACYSSQTGKALSLYKAAGSVTYLNYSLYCAEEPQYMMTFINNGTKYDEVTGYTGEQILIYDPEACGDYEFIGWSEYEYAADNTEEPLFSVVTEIPNEDKTYYAVYSKNVAGESVPTNNYQKITSTSELTDANYLIVADTGSIVALSTTWKDKYYLAPVGMDESENVITTDGDSIIWQIHVDNDQLTLYNDAQGYFYIEMSQSGTKTYYNIKLGNNTTDNKFTYEVEDGVWTLRSVTYPEQIIEYYRSRARWAFYNNPDAPIYLYKQQFETPNTTYYSTTFDCSGGEPTGIETSTMENVVRKLLINGQLFILRDGKIYTIQGARVQ